MTQSEGGDTVAGAVGAPGLTMPTPRELVGAVALLLAYVGLEWVSFIHEYKGVPITPWNPGLGLLFAFMVLKGPRYALLLFAGVLIAELAVLRTSLGWYVVVSISLIISGGYAAVAVAARRQLRLDVGLKRLKDVVELLVAALLGSCAIAVLLSLVLVADHQLELADVMVATWPLLVGDVIGILVMTPLVLRLALRRPTGLVRAVLPVLPEAVVFVAAIALCLWLIVIPQTGFSFFYLLFLPVGVTAVRYGLDGACLALAFTQFGLVGLLHLYGYDARAFTEFQILMLVLSSTGLIVGVVVTERQHAAETLREYEAMLRTKEAEVAQATRLNLVSSMASTLAHEINQPMTAARALARSAQELVRAKDGDLSRADTNLSNLIAQIDHAGGVVRRMRDFLRRGRPHVSTVAIDELLDEVLMLLRLQATESGTQVQIDVADGLPTVHADRVQLQQVVLNLVGNAIEAVGAGGRSDRRVRIRARVSDDAKDIEVAVIDNGPGIAAEIADRLFEPLTTSKHDGLGLGLSICATIIESHGGRIWLHARTPGATEFRFTLPLTARP
jgi:two-component system sensor kinase FixL